jgi:hypothetical protein
MSLPYENATSGKTAVDDMQKIMRAFGASSFGCMEDFDRGEVIVQFEFHGKRVMLKASSKGYAAAWLKAHPYTYRTRGTKTDYERKAIKIGQTAVYSILRDWVKGQVTAIEIGVLSFESAFLGQILLGNGQTVMEHFAEQKLLQIEAPA